MTDEELKQQVDRLAVIQEETFRHIEARQAETDLFMNETFRRIEARQAETGRFMNETFRRMDTERAKTDRFMNETFRRMDTERAKTDRFLKEISREAEIERAKTDRFIKTLGKQVGDLGNKFGSFTEGLALPAMMRLLSQRFKMDIILPGPLARKNGRSLELDLVGYSRQEHGDAYIVEIKSRVREDELRQVLNSLRGAPKFFPELKDKRLYGIVVAVEIAEGMKQRVLSAGLYLVLPHDDTFKLAVPRGFKPKVFHDGSKRHDTR
jgi:hypothetical protein